jgi:hypothetical protein
MLAPIMNPLFWGQNQFMEAGGNKTVLFGGLQMTAPIALP